MGTEIHLEFGGLSLDWAKNHRGVDHGSLFQEQDRRAVHSDQINYDHFRETGDDPTPMEMAFVRKLKDVLPRLSLLGYTMEQARVAYDDLVTQYADAREAIAEPDEPPGVDPLSFDEFYAFANRYPISALNDTVRHLDDWESRSRPQGRFVDDETTISRIPSADHDPATWSERAYFGSCITILHPYLMLHILAGNSANLETDVVWQYGPLLEAGWAGPDEFTPLARRTETFLIATEGSSDAHILQNAVTLLRPEIADFFRFIDVSERHPFPGTGNLLKFAEGLAKIDVQNQIVFVFDNDAEGTEAFNKLGALALPSNMRAMVLPSLEVFRSFPAKGPEGDHVADINGRAAAIECYLDHRVGGFPPPRVVWSNYKRETDCYQGALDHKESYVKAFLKLTVENLPASGYDTSRIDRVLDAVVDQCRVMAIGELAARLAARDR